MEDMVKPFWTDRPVFVTGATGLLGGWLVEGLLYLGAHVVCLVRDEVPKSILVSSGMTKDVVIIHGDVCDRDLLERALAEYEIETVFHLAAQTIVTIANMNPMSTFETNIGGTWKMLEACNRSRKVKQVIVASSDKAYGENNLPPYHEDQRMDGSYPYDVSKSCADLLARAYAKTYDMNVTVTRCANFFGGGDLNWNRIIPGTIRSILRGQAPVIRSDGKYIRDYLYIENAVDAYVSLAEQMDKQSLQGQAFNFSNNRQITVSDLVKTIMRLMDSELQPAILDAVSNEIHDQWLNCTKAKDVLHWYPRLTMEEGLLRTIAWYKEFLGD